MEAIGPVLILLSIPLLFRWVPQNRIYGFRIAATLRDRSVWYDANALAAWHMTALGAVMIALELLLPLEFRTPILRWTAIAGIAVIVAIDWRIANRWARERTAVR